MISIFNFFNKKSNDLQVNFIEKGTYIDNNEKDLTLVFENEELDIEYIFKSRDAYKYYMFFIFNPKIEKAIDFMEAFLKNSIKFKWDILFSDLKNNTFDITKDYSKISKKNYNLILEELDNGFLRLGYSFENKKFKNKYFKFKDMYDENLIIDSLFNTLRYIPQDLGIDTSYLANLKNEEIIFIKPTKVVTTNDNKVSYYLKESMCKDFAIINKDKRFDVFFSIKYKSLENMEMSFYFDKTKKGLVNPILSRLDKFSYSEVNWRKLYNDYYDNYYAEQKVEDVLLTSCVDSLLLYKRYDLVCKIYDDNEKIYFKIEMKERTTPDRYSILE